MKITIDSKTFDVRVHYTDLLPEHPTMSGAQIAAAVGKDAQYEVWLEQASPLPDLFVPMTEPVVLMDGMRFYCIPHAYPVGPPQHIYHYESGGQRAVRVDVAEEEQG